MGLRINTNMAALNAMRNLKSKRGGMDNAIERLSSGYRINKASDDAAGLAVSENLKAQIRGLRQANRNAGDGVSLIQTAEGGLNEISAMLIRLRELSIQSASDTISDNERNFLDAEYQQLKNEVERIAQSTKYNKKALLSGEGDDVDIQVGIYNDPFRDRITYSPMDTNATVTALGLTDGTIMVKEGARSSIAILDNALNQINGMRANLGALQNRMKSTMNNLEIYEENLSAANSRIRDADLAEETAELTKSNIMVQAGAAVLMQANQVTGIALKLLG